MSPLATPPTAPGALPVLGHTMALLRRPLPFLTSLPASGSVVQIRLGPTRLWLVCTPELTRHVLQHDQVFDKGGLLFDRVAEFLGNGLGTCPHREHRRQRRLAQPAFHRSRMPAYTHTMAEQIAGVSGSWTSGQPIDALTEMQAIAARTVIATLVGAPPDDEGLATLIDDFNTLHHGVLRRMLMPPSLNRLPLFGNSRYNQARTRLRENLTRVVAGYRTAGIDHGDILSAMLGLSAESHEQPMSDTEVIDQLITFSFAGTETSAAVMAWALHLLAHHADIQQALQHEVDHVLEGAPAGYGDIPRLGLAGRIVTETLRMFPPGYLLTRTVTRDTELGGYALPAGATVAYSSYLIHHKPGLFPQPERFDPDRWSSGRGLHPLNAALIPFAGGARKCIGDTFAIAEATLALAGIAGRWHLTPTPGSTARPAIGLTLFPKGLRLIPTDRKVAGPGALL